MFCNFSPQLNMPGRRHVFFRALGPETEVEIKLAKNKISFTCSFQKVIRTLAFRGREKFDNSFYLKILSLVLRL